MASVKGKLFEFFVCRLLLSCGFRPVKKDNLLIYDGPAGTMIQGLGQPHNADVLLEPAFQTPFYFPTRLLVECKCYNDTIGLPVIRSAFGLREDVNGFDIVTKDILRKRQSTRAKSGTYYPMKRYTYQVAVASMSGFKATAFPFAQAHRIPLISFSESSLFNTIKACIDRIEKIAVDNNDFSEQLLKLLKDKQYDTHFSVEYSYELKGTYMGFFEEVERFQRRITIGLLEDGTIIFLVKPEDEFESLNRTGNIYNDGFTIHWSEEKTAWTLCDGEQKYYFELPDEIYSEWMAYEGERREAAMSIKQDYFSKVLLFENNQDNWRGSIRTIYLSKRFMSDAENGLRERKNKDAF